MAAQVPRFFPDRQYSSAKPIHRHQVTFFLRVVLTMSALCLLEIDLPFAQAQPDDQLLPTDDSASGVSTEVIPELEILKEETESISRGLLQERPISEAPQNVYVITDEDIR